jgi:hypothetical protein
MVRADLHAVVTPPSLVWSSNFCSREAGRQAVCLWGRKGGEAAAQQAQGRHRLSLGCRQGREEERSRGSLLPARCAFELADFAETAIT